MSLLMGWPGRAQRPTTTVEQDGEASKLKELTMHTHQRSANPIATIGLDIGKNTFHLVGLDKRGAIAISMKLSGIQLVRRLVNLSPCLIGLEAGSGSHHIARQIQHSGTTFASSVPSTSSLSSRATRTTIAMRRPSPRPCSDPLCTSL